MHLLFAAALALLPVHGVVLAPLGRHAAIVRFDPVTQTLPSVTRRVDLAPATQLAGGAGVDGYLDRSTTPWTLRRAIVAAPFSPGVPDSGRVVPVDNGTTLPPYVLVNQNGQMLRLDRAFQGKTLLLSFIFTRCPDRTLCPAISGKYAYMQAHLDPKHFALAEITLDPPYDSPAVLRAYGKQYGYDPKIWSFLTGTGSTIQRLLNSFGITSLRVSTSNFIHSDKLFVVTPKGRVAYTVQTGGWNPDDVVSEARAVDGAASNPFERFQLSLIAGVAAFCGGSQKAGIVLLEIVLFFLISTVAIGAMVVVARVLWRRQTS